MVSFLVRKRVHLGLQPLAGADQLLLFALQLRMLGLQVGQLLVETGPAGQRLTGQILAADLESLLSLLGELVGLSVEAVGLQLDALAAGRHVGDPPTHLLQQLELALVGIVEGLPRIFQLVQGLVGFGAEDHRDALEDAAHEGRLVLPTGFGTPVGDRVADDHRISVGKRREVPASWSFRFRGSP